MWKFIDVIACLISSYFYAYLGAFHNPNPEDNLFGVMVFFETIFFISIVCKFFVEFKKDGQTIPIRNLGEIANRYLRTTFMMDFIPLIPIPIIINLNGYEGHFYAVKVIRVVNGFRIFNVSQIIGEIQLF